MSSETYDSSLFRLATSVQHSTHKNDLVVTVSEGNPIILYRCDRKGWHSSPDDLSSAFLNDKKNKGAKFLVGEEYFFNTESRHEILNSIFRNYNVVEKGKDYFVVKL